MIPIIIIAHKIKLRFEERGALSAEPLNSQTMPLLNLILRNTRITSTTLSVNNIRSRIYYSRARRQEIFLPIGIYSVYCHK